MGRTINTGTLLRKVYKTLAFTGMWLLCMGTPQMRGFWIIYGKEKNGKTWFALKLAEYLSSFAKVLYVSAEEGTEYDFQQSAKRANLDPANKQLQFIEYEPFDEILERLNKRKCPRIIFIDNTTMYQDELKNGVVREIKKNYPNHLFVFLAHEDGKEPDGATAKLIKKLAAIICRIEGLKSFVSGRCPGGVITIDDTKGELYHGSNPPNNEEN